MFGRRLRALSAIATLPASASAAAAEPEPAPRTRRVGRRPTVTRKPFARDS